MKNFVVKKLYKQGVFAKAGLNNIGNLYCSLDNVAYFDINEDERLSVSYYETSDGWGNNEEFFFDNIEDARLFCKAQTKDIKYITLNEKFDAEFYEIRKYDEEDEEYYPIDDETYYFQYAPKL